MDNKKRVVTFSVVMLVALLGAISVIRGWLIVEIIDVNTWSLSQINGFSDAEIRWQKHIPCLGVGFGSPNGAIAVTENQVVFHASCIGIVGSLVAVDLVTGQQSWTRNIAGVSQVTSLGESIYVVFDDVGIRKFDQSGNELWTSQEFSSRSFWAIYPSSTSLAIPFATSTEVGIHLLSDMTGALINTIPIVNPLALNNDVIVHLDSAKRLSVVNLLTSELLWSAEIQAPRYLLQPFDILFNDDLLLVFSDREVIDAYDIANGSLVWSLQRDFGSYPIPVGDKLVIVDRNSDLIFLDFRTGSVLGSLRMKRSIQSAIFTAPDISIGTSDNIVVLAFRDTGEIIAIELAF